MLFVFRGCRIASLKTGHYIGDQRRGPVPSHPVIPVILPYHNWGREKRAFRSAKRSFHRVMRRS